MEANLDNPPWFEELRRQLAPHNLPPDYVRRLMDELADHFEDLKEETMGNELEARTRLGEPRHLAAAAVDVCANRSPLGRHLATRLFVFAVSPILSLIVATAMGVVVLSVLASALGYVDHSGTHFGSFAKAAIPYLLTAMTIVVPAALLTALYCGLARKCSVGRRWMLVSCLVLSVLAGLAMCEVTLSELPGQSRLTLGLGLDRGNLWRLCQALAPLAVGLWLFGRSRVSDQNGDACQSPIPT